MCRRLLIMKTRRLFFFLQIALAAFSISRDTRALDKENIVDLRPQTCPFVAHYHRRLAHANPKISMVWELLGMSRPELNRLDVWSTRFDVKLADGKCGCSGEVMVKLHGLSTLISDILREWHDKETIAGDKISNERKEALIAFLYGARSSPALQN